MDFGFWMFVGAVFVGIPLGMLAIHIDEQD